MVDKQNCGDNKYLSRFSMTCYNKNVNKYILTDEKQKIQNKLMGILSGL